MDDIRISQTDDDDDDANDKASVVFVSSDSLSFHSLHIKFYGVLFWGSETRGGILLPWIECQSISGLKLTTTQFNEPTKIFFFTWLSFHTTALSVDRLKVCSQREPTALD